MKSPQFSAVLEADAMHALQVYATSPSPDASVELRAVTGRVCREAHAAGMKPEAMVVALRQLFGALPIGDVVARERLRGAYDRLLSGCIEVYFAAEQDPD
jgi:hypothetical protein